MRALTAFACLVAGVALHAQDPSPAPPQNGGVIDQDFTDLSLEQLMEVPVDVGNRHSESMASTAASVFVLNEPEIRRSGLRSVPELLRLVPGLIIAQDVPGAYGFSSRLGEYEFAGMLVLLDGQRLYTTLLRREYWQAIDLPVSIIERIEVVRGPGGARWGDKATQGVINIVTKKADKVHGLRLAGVFGNEEHLAGTFRVGQAASDDTSFYLYGKAATRDGGYPTTAGDRWDNDNIGMRLDSQLDTDLSLTLDGNYSESFLGDSYEIDPGYSSLNSIKAGHLKTTVRKTYDADSWTELRVAYDAYDQDIRDYRDDVRVYWLRYREQLFETSLQHSAHLGEGHHVTIGASIRQLGVDRGEVFTGDAKAYNETRGDLFAEWDWDLIPGVRLTLGGNVGYQDGLRGSGLDAQPDARLAWTPAPDFTVWTAFSANREPDKKIADSGLLVRQRASRLLAYELGLRRRFGEVLMLDVDSFAYRIDHQLNGYGTDPGTGATLYVTDGHTDAFGGEVSLAWNPLPKTRLTSFLATTEANAHGIDPTQFFSIEDTAPRLRGGMTFGFDPVPGLELDSNLLYTQGHGGIPGWWRLDLRCGWRPSQQTSIDLVGQNLTEPHHQEYYYLEAAERGVYLMVTQRF